MLEMKTSPSSTRADAIKHTEVVDCPIQAAFDGQHMRQEFLRAQRLANEL